jgi:hypothetical protein
MSGTTLTIERDQDISVADARAQGRAAWLNRHHKDAAVRSQVMSSNESPVEWHVLARDTDIARRILPSLIRRPAT